MVNFTVAIPEGLKAEMDKFPDVNWSELTRKSIQNYLQNKNRVFPPLEFELKEVHFTYIPELMRPSMLVNLKVTKKSLDSQLVIDRMLFAIQFVKEHFVPHGEDYTAVAARERRARKGAFKESWLKHIYLIKDAADITIHLYPPVEILQCLSEKLQASFWIDISIEAYVKDFEHSVTKNLSVKVPIDEWQTQVKNALNSYVRDWEN